MEVGKVMNAAAAVALLRISRRVRLGVIAGPLGFGVAEIGISAPDGAWRN